MMLCSMPHAKKPVVQPWAFRVRRRVPLKPDTCSPGKHGHQLWVWLNLNHSPRKGQCCWVFIPGRLKPTRCSDQHLVLCRSSKLDTGSPLRRTHRFIGKLHSPLCVWGLGGPWGLAQWESLHYNPQITLRINNSSSLQCRETRTQNNEGDSNFFKVLESPSQHHNGHVPAVRTMCVEGPDTWTSEHGCQTGTGIDCIQELRGGIPSWKRSNIPHILLF